MNKFNIFIKKLFHPCIWFSVVFLLFTIAFIIPVIFFVTSKSDYWLSYILEGLAAICFSYSIYIVVYFFPKIKARIKEVAMKNEMTKSYLENYSFKSLVSASISLTINILFAFAQGILAILAHSIWYGSLSLYYLSLCLIRAGIIVKYLKRKKLSDSNQIVLDEIKSYRNCGIYILILTVVLSASLAQIVIRNEGYAYANFMIYAMALYTFYRFTLAIINLVKAKKNDDFTTQSIRNLNLSNALVSMIALQTAMFQAFSENFNPCLPNALTGGAVTLIIILIGIIMIVNGSRKLKKENIHGE